jgi:hypothetical protein
MKYAFVVAALLNTLTIEQVSAITVFTTKGEVAYVSVDKDSSDSSDDEEESDTSSDDEAATLTQKKSHKPSKKSLVELEGDDEVDHSNEFFLPGQHEMLGGGGYERQTPARFAADSDDIFMRSMIEQYALEQKTKEGYPSGRFWMDEAATRAAAAEVLETNCKMAGAGKTEWLNTYFGKAWNHFDVNRSGKVEVSKMPQFMRFICSDQ